MTRKALIKRLGLTSGITIIAASGVLVATAAGGASQPNHHQWPVACQTHRAFDRCDHRGSSYGIRHQRTSQHLRHGSGYAVGNRTGQRWGGCCDMWRNQATPGSTSRGQTRGHHHSDYDRNGYRHWGSRGGRHHYGDRHWGGSGYGGRGGGHRHGC